MKAINQIFNWKDYQVDAHGYVDGNECDIESLRLTEFDTQGEPTELDLVSLLSEVGGTFAMGELERLFVESYKGELSERNARTYD